MIKKNKVKRRGTTLTWIGVVEGYRPYPGAAPKQRTIKSFGYLEDQEDQEAFMKMVEEFDATYKRNEIDYEIQVSSTIKMYSKDNQCLNYGYKFLESIYNDLDMSGFIKNFLKISGNRCKFEVEKIFKFLVISRILKPDSKRATFQLKDNYYDLPSNFTLKEVYRALDVIDHFNFDLQEHLNEKVQKRIGRDVSNIFYDVTNYYFEIDHPKTADDLRQKGVSKEHRVDPIVGMGLASDMNGLPVSMSVFSGNTGESTTLKPIIEEVKNSYNVGRMVVVADKGINSSANMDALVNKGDGFVFSQILKGTKGQRYHDKLFDETGWIENKDNSYRYKMFDEEYVGINDERKKETRIRRVLLYWDKDNATRSERKRNEKLEKAARSVKNNAYGIKKGVDEYTKEEIMDKETGEIYENIKKIKSLNIEKAEKDAKFDGYFCIVTSELDYSEKRIRQVYNGLWRVEQSFRIMKSDLYARPVFVGTNNHIRAHFLICFTALLITRIIQHYMGEAMISAERIATVLNSCTCRSLKGGLVMLDDVGGAISFKQRLDKYGNLVDTLEHSTEDEIANDFKIFQQLFGVDFSQVYHKKEKFNKILKSISVS